MTPTDVFSTESLSSGSTVELFINSNSRGSVPTEGETLGEFVKKHAQAAGIRTFSVYIDGDKANTTDASGPVRAGSKVEIVAKDARGR